MSGNSNRSAAIAAAIIVIGATFLFYVMPKIMLWIGAYSPTLAGLFGVLAVLGFFAIFWIRSRYQKR